MYIKQILGCATVSRKECTIAQMRELEATKVVIPQVIKQGGILCTCTYVFVYTSITQGLLWGESELPIALSRSRQ